MGAETLGKRADVRAVVKELPKSVVLELAHLGKIRGGYVFTAKADGSKFYHVLKKHSPTSAIHNALELFEEAVARDLRSRYPEPTPAQAASTMPGAETQPSSNSSTDRVATGYKLVASRVVLKDMLSWEDLVQLRRSRSVYLGRRYLDQYVTRVAAPVRDESVVDGALLLARHVSLHEKGVTIQNGIEEDVTYGPDHEIAEAAHRIAKELKERGIDPANIDAGAERLCYKDEATKSFSVPPDFGPQKPEKNATEQSDPADEENLRGEDVPGDGEERAPFDDSGPESTPEKERRAVKLDPLTLNEGFELPERLRNVPDVLLEYAAERLTDAQVQLIHQAIKFLARQDDGALKKDHLGFNFHDTEDGNRIAGLEKLTYMEAALARLYLIRYGKKQFAEHEQFLNLRAELLPRKLTQQRILRDADSTKKRAKEVPEVDLGKISAGHVLFVTAGTVTYTLAFCSPSAGIAYSDAKKSVGAAFVADGVREADKFRPVIKVGDKLTVRTGNKSVDIGPVTHIWSAASIPVERERKPTASASTSAVEGTTTSTTTAKDSPKPAATAAAPSEPAAKPAAEQNSPQATSTPDHTAQTQPSAPTPGPSASSISPVSGELNLSPSKSVAAVKFADGSISYDDNGPEAAIARARKSGIQAPVTARGHRTEQGEFQPVPALLQCGRKMPFVKIDGEVRRVSDLQYTALRALRRGKKEIRVLATSADDTGVLHIHTINLEGVETDLDAVAADAMQHAGVPTPAKDVSTDTAARLQSTVESLMATGADTPAVATSVAAGTDTPVAQAAQAAAETPAADAPTSEAEPELPNFVAPNVKQNAHLLRRTPPSTPSI